MQSGSDAQSGVLEPIAAAGGSLTPARLGGRRLQILVLADRDWTHPQGGGTGENVLHNIGRWAQWGHQVTLVTGAHPGCATYERVSENLVVHRMGGRGSVFPRAAWAVWRGLGREADVVLEVINGISFLTPLWLRKPRVALVNHPHRELYVGEFGRRLGRVLAAVFEELPLRLLYRRTPFLTISGTARDELASMDRIPPEHVTIAYCGVEPGPYAPGERASDPRLLYVGRLKAYKRIELLLDIVRELPGVSLDIAGQGDHGETLDDEIRSRGLAGRVRVHGWVDEETKADLYRQAWAHVTASASEGWALTVMEAALCGTPSLAMRVGGLNESIVHEETGLLADTPQELIVNARRLIGDRGLRERLGAAARERALGFTWDRTAVTTLSVVALAAGVPVSQET